MTLRKAFRYTRVILLLDLLFSSVGWGFPIRPGRNSISTSRFQLSARRRSDDYQYYDNYYEEEGDGDDYWDATESEEPKTGYYKVYFDSNVDKSDVQLEWEICSDGDTEALVLLPPASVDKPNAVVHFIGGTFFGSAPKLWYRTFLEGLVRNTQCAIVITPIPVTLFKSPLNHINLSKNLQRAFNMAWKDVLEDEYGEINDIPLCGIGHSLGARLMVVLTTLNKNRPIDTPAFKSFALISFTNYGASAGIPGISTLSKQSKSQELKAQVNGDRKRQKKARRARQDWQIDEDYYDDEVDEEWDELIYDLGELIQESATRVKTALTPKSEDLEFFPTPDNLWKAVKKDARYDVPETLLVQFDDDEIDQSSKLAQILSDTNSTSVKFCRLRGTHLSPISVTERKSGGLLELTSQASKKIGKIMKGKNKSKAEERAMRDLISSVSRYINDVGTK
jgi:hypothetical protein